MKGNKSGQKYFKLYSVNALDIIIKTSYNN